MLLWKAVSLFTLMYGLTSSGCDACNETLHSEDGAFHSPNYPQKYPDEEYCSWRITVSQSQQVFLMFTSFSLQTENNTDIVSVYDGDNATGEVLGVFYGGHPPPKKGIYSSSNHLFIVFKSDNNGSYPGFQAAYHGLNCSDPLGMESGAISDAQLSASSHLLGKGWGDDHSARRARLNLQQRWRKGGSWTAVKNDLNQWLQVDLGSYTKVTRVATQGRNSIISTEWVTKYKIQYSIDGVVFQFYKEPGNSTAKVFDGNQDSDTIVYNKLDQPITARFIRILPVEWHNRISARMEIYGCQGCIAALGMESGAITDAQISASSEFGGRVLHAPRQGRINFKAVGNKAGAWCPRGDDPNAWLQVDLGSFTTVTRVATQGRNGWGSWWVTKYRLQYSDDGVTFQFYKEPSDNSAKVFDGNQDKDTIVYNILNQPITARYIRIEPVTWNNDIAVRMELYGCPGCTAPLGMESKAISDSQISASSQSDDNHSAVQARLHLKADGSKAGGWSAVKNDLNQWLQVDFGSYTKATRVATQGRNAYSEWVKTYTLQYSDDGVTFQFYTEVGDTSAKVFDGNQDSDTVIYNELRPAIKTRYIRLLPTQWNKQISMRIEVFGCPGCIAPVGMESGAISDAQITASSQLADNYAASRARLNIKINGIKQGGWLPLINDLSQWLQVDLGGYIAVTRVATQGRDGFDEWVTRYTLRYSFDGVVYHFYKERGETSSKIFDGNDDRDTVVYNKLNSPITARFVRLLPVEWHSRISIRMEIYGCTGCIAPLGMENRGISDAQISASSEHDGNHAAQRARLNMKLNGSNRGAWSARINDFNQWLQVDLGRSTAVTRVATQGRNRVYQWVTKYMLQYSDDGMNFHFYKDLGDNSAKIFDGNQDRNTIVYNKLSQPITSRYIRIQPVAWYNHISMRMELYGCQTCAAALGMESDAIEDSLISASSQLDDNHSAARARLHFKADGSKDGGWSALRNDLNQWLQVDFGSYTKVNRVATQGRHAYSEWITKYRLQYSDDGVTFKTYKEPGNSLAKVFDGNQDSDAVVYNKLNPPITARFVRLLPVEWHSRISMRMEIYGCPACIAPLGMENEAISDIQISASSQQDDNHAARHARLHFKTSGNTIGGWSARKNNLNQWLQVDLGSYTKVTRVATQGRNTYSEWVTKYRLQYSDEGFIFLLYKEAANTSARVFNGNKDSDTVVYNILNPPITTRFIRISPVEWHNQISIRMEIYGCPGCIAPLGVENRAISDTQITASSQWDDTHSATEARLHSKSDGSKRGGWSALKNDPNQWLQVDLVSYITVTRVATQGRNRYDQWVTKFRLQCSDDGDTFHFFQVAGDNSAKVFSGNQDNDTVVYNPLSPPITTRFIRLMPVEWHNHISMRIEIYGCPGCIAALGMALETISDAQISASSQLDVNHSAIQARLHLKAEGSKVGAWSALKNDLNQWLQVDFGSYTKVTRVATQGRNAYSEWVKKYMLQYSDDGASFHAYKEAGNTSAKVFDGNQDSDTVVWNKLIPPITTRFIRLIPVDWHNHISIRTEIYGCPGCIAPLGMESGAISDAQITASSQWSGDHAARQARLNLKQQGSKRGAWSTRKNDLNQWLQVDFGRYTTVTRVATQGRNDKFKNQWVTKYRLQYSGDGVTFQLYKEKHHTSAKVFLGNQDRNTVVYNILNPPITARYIRILPMEWYGHISMRTEMYGCQACTAPLGMENRVISDVQIRASSQQDADHAAWRARLHITADGSMGGGWSALANNFNQWLQVDLNGYTTVTRVATQGQNGRDQWVTKYRLQYSYAGVTFKFFKMRVNSSAKVFDGNKDSDSVISNTLSQPITTRYIRILPIEWHNHISMRVEMYGCPGCIAPLGMESENIADAQISASTIQDDNSSPRLARLHLKADGSSQGGWTALKNDLNQWIQVDLGSYTKVTRVATQGRNAYSEWVTKFRLQYIDDGVNFQFYQEAGTTFPKVFDGNQDSDTVVYNTLSPPITTTLIRLSPVEWHNRISMRIELYGCPGCVAALGMENEEISDAQISASSELNGDNAAVQARLYLKMNGNKQGGWSALINDFNQWLNVDLGSYTTVTRVATQGENGRDQWVTRYRLQFSDDGVIFNFVKKTENSSAKVFYGNQDSDTINYNILSPPIKARFVRILPVEWHNHISMRIEIYGCPAPPPACPQKTTSGQCCSIPFTYKGVTYKSCTKADHHSVWCSLDPVYKGKWGNCLIPTPTVCLQKTTSGQCCSIPFTYKGVTYKSCTKADHQSVWCSLDPVYKGKWGSCLIPTPTVCHQKTTSGQCCSIPFTYKGVTYKSCTKADHHSVWCSLDPVYKGNWGNCLIPTPTVCTQKITSGQCCSIPFTYKNVTYKSCTIADHHSLWCSLDPVYKGKWGKCLPTATPITLPTKTTTANDSKPEENDGQTAARQGKDTNISVAVTVVVCILIAALLLAGLFYWSRRRANKLKNIMPVRYQRSSNKSPEGAENPLYDRDELLCQETKDV